MAKRGPKPKLIAVEGSHCPTCNHFVGQIKCYYFTHDFDCEKGRMVRWWQTNWFNDQFDIITESEAKTRTEWADKIKGMIVYADTEPPE